MRQSLSSILSKWEKINYSVSLWFERISMVAILIMVIATFVDVIGSKLFTWPMPAGTEVVYLAQVIAIAAAIAITKIDGGHVRIEFIDALPRRGKALFGIIVSILGIALFIMFCWQSFLYADSMRANNEVTATARILLYPFISWVAICTIPVISILLKDLLSSSLEVSKK